MIRHIVCFKFKENEKSEFERAKEILLSMKGKVPTAKCIAVNINELASSRSYDIMLDVLLDSFSALEDYQNDEYHCGVVKKYMHEHTVSSISLDFTV